MFITKPTYSNLLFPKRSALCRRIRREEFTCAKDKCHIFWENELLKNANVVTFKILELGYATDGRSVYYHARIVKNADAPTFRREEHENGDNDAADKNNKYLAKVKL